MGRLRSRAYRRSTTKAADVGTWSLRWSAFRSAIAYATIYSNQIWIALILAVAVFLTAFARLLFGRWFIRPLLEIIEVTQQLHQGQLHDRTNVKRQRRAGRSGEPGELGGRPICRGDQPDPGDDRLRSRPRATS